MFQRQGQHDMAYIADTVEDLKTIPQCNMGSTCYVIATAEKYMINSKGEWINQTRRTSSGGSNNGTNIDLSEYATIAYSDAEDAKIVAYSDAQDAAIVDSIDDTVNEAVEKAVSNIEVNPEWDTIPEL